MSILNSACTMIEGVKIVGKVMEVANLKNDEGSSNQAAQAINPSAIQDAAIEGDMIRILKATLVEPTILVTENALFSDIIDNINNVLADNFVAYYIQVFDMLTKVGGMSGIQAIDLLSTDLYPYQAVIDKAKNKIARNIKEKIKTLEKEQKEVKLGLESLNFDSALTYMNNEEYKSYKYTIKMLAKEAEEITDDKERIKELEQRIESQNERRKEDEEYLRNQSRPQYIASDRVRKETLNSFFDPKDGSLCKLLTRKFEVTIQINTKSQGMPCFVNIPIIVRANVKVVDINELTPILNSKDAKKSLLARFYEWRSGAISLFDLIFCGDLITDYKKGKLDKNSKLLTEIEKQNTAAYLRKAMTGNKGFETMYTSLVLTNDEINYLSKMTSVSDHKTKVFGTGLVDLESNTGKDFLLNAINGFMLTVIDTERVRVYTKGIKGCLDVNHKAFKRRSNENNDVLDFFKALTSGNAIRF